MGDFNSRTARLPDYIELDGNLLNSNSSNILSDNYTIDIEMPPRHNKRSQWARKKFDRCLLWNTIKDT